jgi:hypothetical protein
MGREEDGAAGGLVDAAALHADEAVFHHVDAADAVASAEEVEDAHDAVGSEEGVVTVLLTLCFTSPSWAKETGAEVGMLEADAVAFFEEDLDVFGLVRRFLGGNAEDIHVLRPHRGGGVVPGSSRTPLSKLMWRRLRSIE